MYVTANFEKLKVHLGVEQSSLHSHEDQWQNFKKLTFSTSHWYHLLMLTQIVAS
jgi:hypothetical protein